MKFFKFIFLLIFIQQSSGQVFKYAESSFSAPFQPEKDRPIKDGSFSAFFGSKFIFEGLDLRAYSELEKTDAADLFSINKLKENKSPWRYGIAIQLYEKSTPLSLKFGNLSFSDSISRLTRVGPVVVNPLTESFSFYTGTGAALPSLSSSQKPQAADFSLNIPGSEEKVKINLQGFITEENNKAFCSAIEIKKNNLIRINGALTLTDYYIQNESDILEKNNCSFSGERLKALMGEFYFSLPFFKFKLRSALHETPYSSSAFWFNADFKYCFRNFMLNFSYFAIPTSRYSPAAVPLIENSSSISRTLEQFSINPQVKFIFHDKNSSSLRIGLAVTNGWKITSSSIVRELQIMKIKSAAEYSSRTTDMEINFTADNILINGEPPNISATPEKYYGTKIVFSPFKMLFPVNFSGEYRLYPAPSPKSSRKEKITMAVRVNPGTRKTLSSMAGVDLTLKEGELYSGNFNASSSFRFKMKKIQTYAKVEVKIPLQ